MVLQVQAFEPRGVPFQVFFVSELVKHPIFAGPVHSADHGFRSFRQIGQDRFPTFQNPVRLSVRSSQVFLAGIQNIPLQFQGGGRISRSQFHVPLEIRIARNGTHGLDRVCENPFPFGDPQLHDFQHESCGPHLHGGRKLTHGGVANQKMYAPIFARVRQGFVAGVDNRPVILHPPVKFVGDVIGPL